MDCRISEARLLTMDEAVKIDKNALKYKNMWWLSPTEKQKTDGYKRLYAPFVDGANEVRYGLTCDYQHCSVRPVLVLRDNKYSIGKTFSIGDLNFSVISSNLALLDGEICHHPFGKNNDYETSDIKLIVDDWYKHHIKPFVKSKLQTVLEQYSNSLER